MQEFEVQFVSGGTAKVAAPSQKAAEELMRADGHAVMPKEEAERRRADWYTEKRTARVQRMRVALATGVEAEGKLESALATILAVVGRGVFKYSQSMSDRLEGVYLDGLRQSRDGIADALGVLRVALPFAQRELRRVEVMSWQEYADEFGD